MEFPKYSFFKETASIAVGMVICVAAMIGVYALLGRYDTSVLLGGAVGGLLAMAYYLSMVICANIATKKALEQDVQGGQKLMQLAHPIRLAVLFGLLVLCALTKKFNLLALVLPIVFVRPILGVADLISRKKGNAQ